LTNQTEITIYENAPTTGLGYGVYTATIAAQNDTVTLSNFDTLIDGAVIKLEDNSALTFTLATNVVTVTSSVTDEKVLIIMVGI